MNVILEAQHAVGRAQLRGVGQYALCMIDALLKRRQNEYALTFFDKGREMGNRERAEQHFGRYHVPFYECNTLDYRVATRDDAVFAEKSYNDYTGARGDVFHFMNLISIPTNLQGRMVVTVHDMLFCTFPELTPAHNIPIYSKGFERLQKMKPYIIAISDYSKQQLMRRADFDETRVFTVPNGWDRSRIYFEEDPGRAGLRAMGINGEYILFLSALDLYKNPIRLIEAFDRIAGKFSGLQLVLAGKSYFDDDAPIREAAEKSAYRKRILFPGFVDERQKRLLYSNALCFAFPSLMEGFGLPPLEAMGCPARRPREACRAPTGPRSLAARRAGERWPGNTPRPRRPGH